MEVIGTGYEFAHNDDYDRTIKEMGDATCSTTMSPASNWKSLSRN
jgi:hypothetical protein